ncbi:MAG: potassium channel protein [Nanoarchaeota archaeon]|nr:potassium channel protein [Nanoarchaeota archaeon]
MEKDKRVSFWGLLLLAATLVVVGTLGYMFIEGWNALDSVYMVVITLATVGFREVHVLSPAGIIFTILLIVFGLVTLYYVIRTLGEYMLENKLEENLNLKRMERTLKHLAGHYIVCGFGRVGRQVVRELTKEAVQFVVVEKDIETLERCKEEGNLCVLGDANDEHVLKQAGAMNAKGLIVCLGRDSDAVLTIVTAKSLNHNLFVVARANQQNTASKLLQVGADRVVSPHEIGAFRMVNFALNPEVADFLDDVQDLSNKEIEIDDVIVANTSPVAGHSIASKLSNRNYGVSVLAIHKPDGNAIINPTGDAVIDGGDRLILLGTRDKLANVLKMLGGKPRS